MASKEDRFIFISNLLKCQLEMLRNREDSLTELYDICENKDQLELVKELITDFSEMNDEVYNLCLLEMANVIIGKGFSLDECFVVAMAHDHTPDSSQNVLQDLKLHLGMKGFPSKNYCNRIDRSWKKDFLHIRHFFVVDDFVGSGSTVLNRKKEFERRMNEMHRPFTLHFVTVAGMKFAIDYLCQQGVDLFCCYPLLKGISEKYPTGEVEHKLAIMGQLEAKLASKVNSTSLSDYHLGYKESESLFCRRNRNIPNNVFPLFWWKGYADGIKRNTLYTRVQDGY